MNDLEARRRAQCAACVGKCWAWKVGKLDPANPSAGCARMIWERPPAPVVVPPSAAPVLPAPDLTAPMGLGDWVDVRAKPIARWIDARTRRLPIRLRTRLAGCSACSRRRGWLNRRVPDVRSWRGWLKALGFKKSLKHS